MKIRLTHPLVSCICITDNRPFMLTKAIYSFDTQNYPNRELVISYPENDTATEEVLAKISRLYDSIKIVSLKRKMNCSLGKARNHAIANCNGDYICIWDDDDIYHYTRISQQFNAMQGNYYQAGVLSSVMFYDAMTRNGFISALYNWPGTLICRKDLISRYPYTDDDINEGAYLIESLDSRNLLLKVHTVPFAYTYVHHQENITDYAYFLESLLYKSKKLNGEASNYLREQFEMRIYLP